MGTKVLITKRYANLCDYIENNPGEFVEFLDDTDPHFESYVSRMREDGEWGGNLELTAASRLFRYARSCIVHIVCAFFCPLRQQHPQSAQGRSPRGYTCSQPSRPQTPPARNLPKNAHLYVRSYK